MLSAPWEDARNLHEISVRAGRRFGAVDVTGRIRRAIAASGIEYGSCLVYVRHTTSALVINEWEDGLVEDVGTFLERIIPARDYYAHDDLERRTQNVLPGVEEPPNAAAHLAQMLLGATSLTIPIVGHVPVLGTWQRVILIELDEPRDRSVLIQLFRSA